MPSDHLGEGLTRSASGRTTYAPNGLSSNPSSTAHGVNNSDNPWETTFIATDRNSFESTTPVERRSVDEKDPEKDEVPPHHSKSPPHQPTGPYESDNVDDDIERQKTREQGVQVEKQAEEKDPNLVEWNGSDDPVSDGRDVAEYGC